jgi:hypothetical protein
MDTSSLHLLDENGGVVAQVMRGKASLCFLAMLIALAIATVFIVFVVLL